MVDRVSKLLSARGIAVDPDIIVDRLSREIIPALIELRQRFNELLSPADANAYTVTNPVTRRSFDTTTVTLQQLAEVIGTIVADLQASRILR